MRQIVSEILQGLELGEVVYAYQPLASLGMKYNTLYSVAMKVNKGSTRITTWVTAHMAAHDGCMRWIPSCDMLRYEDITVVSTCITAQKHNLNIITDESSG